jgi:hypothetical protein
MTWNKDGAISYAKSHAQPKSTGYCAHYVTEAIRTGGRLKIPNTRLAKDMGRTLVNTGFRLVYDQPHAGDVAVIQILWATIAATFAYTMVSSGSAILYNALCIQDRPTETYSLITNCSGMTNENTLLFTFRPVSVRCCR